MEGVVLFLFSLAVAGAAVHARENPEVEFTYRRLFRNYNRDLLPEYGGGPAVIHHGLFVTEFRDVDSFRERITVVAWEQLVSFNLKSKFRFVHIFCMVRRIPTYFLLYRLCLFSDRIGSYWEEWCVNYTDIFTSTVRTMVKNYKCSLYVTEAFF